MIERILKEKLHLSDKQIEDLNTLIYFEGYDVSDEMSVDGNSVVLVSRFEETHNDSIVRITYEPISQNILVRMRSFVYGKDEEAISDSKIVLGKNGKVDLAMEYQAKGETIRGSVVNGVYTYYSDRMYAHENILDSVKGDVVTATLLGKVKFLANAKTELPLDKPISNDGFVL
ncbi:MAG: hypothetical protein SO009_00815 [Bacilli bacterium]|nr:hypothetical protein [Bacilli bacterium]